MSASAAASAAAGSARHQNANLGAQVMPSEKQKRLPGQRPEIAARFRVSATRPTADPFSMLENSAAPMTTDRTDRPSGRVRIDGYPFGASSSLDPDHRFCGGNLEFTHHDGRKISTTTEIRALQLVPVDAPPCSAGPCGRADQTCAVRIGGPYLSRFHP